MSKLSKEFKSGFIFLLAIVFLVYGLKYLKGLNVFEANKPYYAIYDEIDGLQVGSAVRLNGFNVGMVNAIVLNDNNNLLVTLNITEIENIPENSICKIVNQDLMGTKGVSLILGNSQTFAKSGDTLLSGIENSLQDEVNAQILPLKNKAEGLIGSVDSLLTIVTAVLNKNTRKSLSNSIKSLDETFTVLSSTMTKIDSMVYQNDARVSKILSNLESITLNLNDTSSGIKPILYNLSSISDSLSKSNFSSLINNIDKLSNNINNGSGTLSKLMKDEKLYNNFEKSTSELAELIEDITDAVITGLADYCRKSGIKSIVLGLSGGIDSAVAACVACAAVGSENVLGIAMPSRYSSQHSLDDARYTAQALGMQFKIESIDDMHSILEAQIDSVLSNGSPVASENIQSRLRGIIVMAHANAEGRMAVATGNKSELAQGYCTLYGDMAGGYTPLGDLYKMQVYALAEVFNSRASRSNLQPPVNSSTMSKPPSAELSTGQVDPFDYNIVSPIVDAIIEDGKTDIDLKKSGLEEDLVDLLYRKVRMSEFKRRQAAPGLRVSTKAFGIGRRFPIVNHFEN